MTQCGQTNCGKRILSVHYLDLFILLSLRRNFARDRNR